MQTSVIALLFVTASVMFASVVVNYAVVTCEQTVDLEDSPQIDQIRELENMLLNQTDSLLDSLEHLNQTTTQLTETVQP